MKFILPLIIGLVLSACNSSSPAPSNSPVPSNLYAADCALGATVIVWNDSNANSKRDQDESLIHDVKIHLSIARSGQPKEEVELATDQNGFATLQRMITCDERGYIDATLDLPTGYVFVTPPKVRSQSLYAEFEFGLRQAK